MERPTGRRRHPAVEWPLLASVGELERRALLDATRRRTFARGDIVMHEGDPADSLHLVEAGHFAVRASTSQGEAVTLNVLGPGQQFGELSLVSATELRYRSATVQALDSAVTLSMGTAVFQRLCEQHPDVERLLVTMLAARVRELSDRLLEALHVGLDRRLYRRLLELDDLYGGEPIPLTQEQLADLVGGTRPSVNQVLQRLVIEGCVELGRGRVSILDPVTLERRAGR